MINQFVDRVFDDVMIGFFFRNAKKERIQEFEYQLAAEYLGAPITYEGRPLRDAHRRHPIMGGQFARRKKILSDVLREHDVPDDIHDAWMEHTESLRPLITRDVDSDCDPDAALAMTKDKS